MADKLETEVHELEEVMAIDRRNLPDGNQERHVNRGKDSKVQGELQRNQVTDGAQGIESGKCAIEQQHGENSEQRGNEGADMSLPNHADDRCLEVVVVESNQQVRSSNNQRQRSAGGNSYRVEFLNQSDPQHRTQDRQENRAAHIELRPSDARTGLTCRACQNIRPAVSYTHLT